MHEAMNVAHTALRSVSLKIAQHSLLDTLLAVRIVCLQNLNPLREQSRLT